MTEFENSEGGMESDLNLSDLVPGFGAGMGRDVFTIRDLAKEFSVSARTLRFYEEKGLIQSTGRSGLRRLFDAGVIERLALIALGRNAGFSLDEIGEIFTPEGPKINRKLLSTKADELDKKIKELTAMRNGLRHAAASRRP